MGTEPSLPQLELLHHIAIRDHRYFEKKLLENHADLQDCTNLDKTTISGFIHHLSDVIDSSPKHNTENFETWLHSHIDSFQPTL